MLLGAGFMIPKVNLPALIQCYQSQGAVQYNQLGASKRPMSGHLLSYSDGTALELQDLLIIRRQI